MGEIKVVTLREKKRRCGYRRSGKDGVGIYMMGPECGLSYCERLPFPLAACPCCGHGIKFSRGWTWIDPSEMFHPDNEPACDPGYPGHNHQGCPMCNPREVAGDKAGLLWVGQNNYTTSNFVAEALEMGISKRMASVPRGFEVGKHYVYLAHLQAVRREVAENAFVQEQGVFTVFKPTHFDLVIDDAENIPGRARALKKALGDNARIVKVVRDE